MIDGNPVGAEAAEQLPHAIQSDGLRLISSGLRIAGSPIRAPMGRKPSTPGGPLDSNRQTVGSLVDVNVKLDSYPKGYGQHTDLNVITDVPRGMGAYGFHRLLFPFGFAVLWQRSAAPPGSCL